MGILNSHIAPIASQFSGYGGRPASSYNGARNSRLAGIGQTTIGNITGRTAVEALDKYAASGATPSQVDAAAAQIAQQWGR